MIALFAESVAGANADTVSVPEGAPGALATGAKRESKLADALPAAIWRGAARAELADACVTGRRAAA